MILASPFTSAFGHRPWMRLFPFDWFRNHEHIGLAKAPILVLHGVDDSTISVENARALAALANATFVAIPARGHGDLHEDAAYRDSILRWAEALK